MKCHLLCCQLSVSSLLTSTPKPKNRPPSPAAPKSRPLSPLVPAAASKTLTGKKTPPPGTKTRPKRAQTPARVQTQTVAAVAIDKDNDPQQLDTPEEKKSECPSFKVTSRFWPTFVLRSKSSKVCASTDGLYIFLINCSTQFLLQIKLELENCSKSPMKNRRSIISSGPNNSIRAVQSSPGVSKQNTQ